MAYVNENSIMELLEIILTFSSDGIFIADKNYRTVAYSETYRMYLGASKDELNNMSVIDFYNEGWLSYPPLFEVMKTKKQDSQIITYYKTGREILATGIPILDDNNYIRYVVLSFVDVSELRKLEAELRISKKLLNQYISDSIAQKSNNIFKKNYDKYGLIYISKSMKQLTELLETLAKNDANILFLGETGVGKTMIAEVIHNLSKRSAKGRFIKIDCSSIPESLMESELFGYEKGSFTGANTEGKVGLIELADKGTLFLDEIGEIPLNLQSKILTVIEEKKIKRIGAKDYTPINMRIISATNRNLEEMVSKSLFRKDLYYRLNVLPVTIPPLRERKEDILHLVKFYENYFCEKYNIKKNIPDNVYYDMLKYNWPGNVRELIHVVERLVLLDPMLVMNDIGKQDAVTKSLDKTGENENIKLTLKSYLQQEEKNYLIKIIGSTRTLKECAEILDIDISTLVRKLKKYNIRKAYQLDI